MNKVQFLIEDSKELPSCGFDWEWFKKGLKATYESELSKQINDKENSDKIILQVINMTPIESFKAGFKLALELVNNVLEEK